MAKTFLRAALAVLLLAGAAGAQPAPAPSVALPKIPVIETVLPNGMKLLMVVRRDSPTIACGWVARVGSVNEPPGITGISHLFEHMMFKGTKAIGTKDFAKDAEILAQQDVIRAEMEKEYTVLREKQRRGEITGEIYDSANMTSHLKELKGQIEKLYAAEKEVIVKEELDSIYTAQGGSGVNAGTTEDQTFYFVTVPSNKLELWFWLESDRLANPVFREFYSERDVVREERRLRTESTPTGRFEEAFEAVFWESSPYSHPVVGWPSDVESITRAQAENYFGIYYAPNNITAALVGDFDPDKAVELAKRYFGRVPSGKNPPPEMITTEMPQYAEKRFLAEADTNPEVQIRFHAVPFNHKDMFAFQLVADILNKRTGRLYTALVEEQKVAVGEPSSYYRPLKYEGFFEVSAEVKDGKRPEDVEAALNAELARLAREPIGERELQKVKNQELANSYRRLQSNFYLLLQLLLYDSTDTWTFLNESPAKIQAVTAADIQRVAARCFTAENRNVAVYVRKAGSAPEDPEIAALPEQMKGMVKQQLAQIQSLTERAKLEQILTQLSGMSGRMPPQMKPAMDYLIRKAQEHLDSLPPATSVRGRAAEEPTGREAPGVGAEGEERHVKDPSFADVRGRAAFGRGRRCRRDPGQAGAAHLSVPDLQRTRRGEHEGEARQRGDRLRRGGQDAAPGKRAGALPRRAIP
jgi:predicted Zn-dependent peptidase